MTKRQPSAYRFRKWEDRLIHLQQRNQSLPDGLLDWTVEYFSKSSAVQRLLGMHNQVKPELGAADQIQRRLDSRGVMRRSVWLGKR